MKKGTKKTYRNKSKAMRKVEMWTYISIITLNGNELNAPKKKKEIE